MIVNPNRGSGISSLHKSSVVALFADGHTHTLTNDTPADVLHALLTIDGGEEIPDY
jgi:prepilin-type processing-associated H-X9-DG protein